MVKRALPASAPHLGVILMMLALAACGGGDPIPQSGDTPESHTIACKGYEGNQLIVKPKTITIFNNSEKTIYPVLATSKNSVNEWIQGCFRTTEPYPTNYVYKLYVNETEGIPKNTSVEITLPLYSELSKDRYITWWNGGRVVLADNNERLRGKQDTKLAAPIGVSCRGESTGCVLSTYSSDVQFPENIYAQLSEYTFGDSIIPAGQQQRLLKPENVGYNISYVDHVYMPMAIGPKNNPYIGYSGSTQSIASFRTTLNSFLESPSGKGWPVYNLNELKLPGGYNIFAQRFGTLPPLDNVPVKPSPDGFPPVLTVLACIKGQCSDDQKKNLHFDESVQRIQNLWGSCADWGGEDINGFVKEKFQCPQDLKTNMGLIKQFFEKNHQDYLQLYSAGKCEGTTPSKAVFNYWEAISHIYGWVPFNEGCGAAANPLAGTTFGGWNHAKIQPLYIDELQYNHQQDSVKADSKLTFNPYVKLIHDDLLMNAYAFSVDDAVGFMSELGEGLIFTVGGAKGLENKKQFNYANGFSVAIGVPQSMSNSPNTPLIKKYGVCVLDQDASDLNCEKDKQDVTMPVNSQVAGFRVGSVAAYPIKVRFTDLNDNVYIFVVNEQFAPCTDGMNSCPTNKAEIIKNLSCSVADKQGKAHPQSSNWCVGANPNQQGKNQMTKNYLSFPQPVDLMQ
jgi:hypothetical protein